MHTVAFSLCVALFYMPLCGVLAACTAWLQLLITDCFSQHVHVPCTGAIHDIVAEHEGGRWGTGLYECRQCGDPLLLRTCG